MSVSVYSDTLRVAVWWMAWALLLPASTGAAQTGAARSGDNAGVLTREFDGQTLRDPTQPPGASLPMQSDGEIDQALLDAGAGAIRRYRVSFIRAGGREPMAVINDESVTVGEEVGGARVVAISSGQVELDVNGETRTIRPWRGNAVRRAASEQQLDPEDGQNP